MDDLTLIEQLNALKKNSEKLSSSDHLFKKVWSKLKMGKQNLVMK